MLKKNFPLIQLLQIPIAFFFGYMTDFTLYLINTFNAPNYFIQWIYTLIGIILVGVGVGVQVSANVANLAGEGFDIAVSQVFQISFKKAKIIKDVSLVLLS